MHKQIIFYAHFFVQLLLIKVFKYWAAMVIKAGMVPAFTELPVNEEIANKIMAVIKC